MRVYVMLWCLRVAPVQGLVGVSTDAREPRVPGTETETESESQRHACVVEVETRKAPGRPVNLRPGSRVSVTHAEAGAARGST